MNKIEVLYEKGEENYSSVISNVGGSVLTFADTFEELKTETEEALKFHIEGLEESEIPEILKGEYELAFKELKDE